VSVLALVTGVTVAAADRLGGSGQRQQAGGPRPSLAPAPDVSKSGFPTGSDGKPMQDRTARAGTEYETGKLLLERLLTAVPSGYTSPDRAETSSRRASRYHQANFDDWLGDKAIWSYQAQTEVSKAGKTGLVLVEVHQPGLLPADVTGCALTRLFWGLNGVCQLVQVGGAQVPVAAQDPSDSRIDQWAAYRYPDGVVVFVAQTKVPDFTGDHDAEKLLALPFSAQHLAALAMDERFHVIH
jgi:hypothetical protein